MKNFTRIFLVMLVVWQVAPLSASASEITGRLQRIHDYKTIVMGYYETGMPFSYLDNSGPRGFGVEVSKRIANAIKAHLKLDTLNIRWNPMTVSTRMTLIMANVIDLECTSTSHKRSREARVGFTNTIFIASSGIVTRADNKFTKLEDLYGKRVVVSSGSRVEGFVRKLANVTAVIAPNNQRAMQAVAEGKADAFYSNLGLLTREMLRVEDSRPYRVYGLDVDKSAYACMVPKGDTLMKKIADKTISSMMMSGEMEKLFRKWFSSPIPPYGRNANVALNDLNKNLYKNPNDKPFE